MTDRAKPTTGGCMCGAVRYEAVGEALDIGYCHCHSCRRHTGAPVVTFVVFEADNVHFTGFEMPETTNAPEQYDAVRRGPAPPKPVGTTYHGDEVNAPPSKIIWLVLGIIVLGGVAFGLGRLSPKAE